MSHATTKASRTDAVLLVIDIQERLSAAMVKRDSILTVSSKLIRTAALVGTPVVVTRQYPNGLGDVEPALREVVESVEGATSTLWVDKVTFDCFAEPTFVQAMKGTGRRQIVITGMESHICVTQTALSALDAGYDVHVVEDGCCSRDAATHDSALARLRAAGAIITTMESVLYELVGAAGTDEFRALLRIVKE